MRHRALIAAALALVMGAGAAWAAGSTFYVSPSGSGTHSGANPANAHSWAEVVNNWGADDRYQLAAGTYPVSVNITLGGSPGGRVMIVGDLANPANVVFTGSLSVSNRHYISLRGVTFNGNASWDVSQNDSLTDVRVLGSATFNGFQNGVVQRFTFGTANSATRFNVSYSGTSDGCERISGTISQNSKFEDGTVYAGVTGTGAEANAWGTSNSHEIAFRRIRFSFYFGPGVNATHPVIWYRMKNCVLEDSRLSFLNQSTASGTGNYIWAMRDSSIFNRIERDTFVVDTTGAGTGKFDFAISGTGFSPSDPNCPLAQQWSGSGSCKHNTYRNNLVDIDGGFAMFNVTHGDSVIGNSFYTDGGMQYLWGDSLTMAYNTFYARTASLVIDTDAGQPSPAMDAHHNIFYAAGGAGVHNWTPSSRLPSRRAYDRNLYYSRIATDSTNATNDGRVGPGSSRCLGSAMDCNSRWIDPQFTKPSRPNVDLRPLPGSLALATNLWGGTYVGAFGDAPTDTCLDADRPGRVSNLASGGITRSTISATWTEAGSDQFSNDDSQTTVEVRTNTVAITDANWSTSTVAFSSELGAPGAVRTEQVASGLALGATRYFAVRYRDGDGNQGCLSNTFAATTVDAVAPGAISDLEVETTTGTTADISWTAPGDDGGTGTAASYLVRYRLNSPIASEADWSGATSASGPPTPSVAGSAETMTVSGLTSDRVYYFAVRALDPSGNLGALSNSPAGVTLDVTAPSQITTLTSTGVTETSVSLRWTAVGDDGGTGTASTNAGRYTTSGPITNEAAWTAAAAIPAMPPPQVAGTVQSVTVAGLAPGTTYHFAVRSVDESGNVGAISNSVSRTTITVDATRPARPSIVASQISGKPDAARIVFAAVGDDSLTGTATSYTLRYRIDNGAALTEANWNAGSNLNRTYRVPVANVPKAAGAPETLIVRGLRPGRTVWFALKATDDTGLESALSAVDSTTPPASAGLAYAQPAPYSYGGAGPGSRPAWFPVVSLDGSAVDTARCRAASRRVAISFAPEFADSAGPFGKLVSIAALQTIRAMNPAIRLLAEPVGAVSYFRAGADSLDTYAYRMKQWQAARIAGGGWTTGSGHFGGSWTAGGYTDSTGTPWILWTNVPGYKGWMYQTYNGGRLNGVSDAGVAGLSTWNLNLAYQPAAGVFPVADSMADVVIRQFVLRRGPDGAFVWDGIRFDLWTLSSVATQLQYENIDHVRAGYATKAAFDTAWAAASDRMAERIRRAAIDAGRPDFVLSGNGGSQLLPDRFSGWMRENYPLLQGGDRWTNYFWFPGGAVTDQMRQAYYPHDDVIFPFECGTDSCTTDPYSSTAQNQVREGLGAAALTDAAMNYGPAYASIPKGAGYHERVYDEFAVDTVTAQAAVDTRLLGWLGTPSDYLRFNLLPIGTGVGAGGDLLWNAGLFENGDVADWTLSSGSQVAVGAVTDTVYSGTTALRARVASPQAFDFSVVAHSNIKSYGAAGDTFTVTFMAKADAARPFQVGFRGETSGQLRSSFSTNCRQWAWPAPAGASASQGWRPYSLTGTLTAGAAESLRVVFWFGDTTGTVWIDNVRAYKGRPRGGSLVREFRRGAVIVNPYGRPDTVTFGRMTRRISAIAGRSTAVNDGTLLAAGAAIVVPARDARFLLFPVDSLRPSRVTDLVAAVPTSSSARLSWTSPGNDSATGAALVYQIRQAAAPIVSEGDWSAASLVGGAPTPLVAGTAQTLTVTGLAPSSTYYYALRAYDAAGFVGAISNSDSVVTLGVGTPPTAAFSLDATSGAEPLAVAATDLSTGGPTAWEWYARRLSDEGDPQISGDENPSFIFSLGGTYLVTLQVSNAYGSDSASALVTVACTNPSPITTIAASAVNSTSISVIYKEPGDDGDVGAAALIEIRYVEGSTFAPSRWASATPVSGVPIPTYGGTPAGVVVSGLLPGKTYAFAAKATDSGGCVGDFGQVAVASTLSGFQRAIGVTVGLDRRVRVRVGGRR